MILAANIGTKTSIENWPSNDLDGLFDALKRWELDTRLDSSDDPAYAGNPGAGHFRGRAWGSCSLKYNDVLKRSVAVATKPIYPDKPDAVRYFGNFVGHSFGFCLDTDNADLIKRLDQAIAENISTHLQNQRRPRPFC